MTLEALQKFKSQEPQHTGASFALGTEMGSYEFLSKQPELAKRFANAMSSFSRFSSQPSNKPRTRLIQKYPWGAIGEGTVVDVGGSRGIDCFALAQAYPQLQFVVQDLPRMIIGAEASIPPNLVQRIRFMPYNFFTPQTVEADVYLIKQCFHNWPDHYCVRILKNQIPALRPRARIVVSDSVVPEPGTMSLMAEKTVRCVFGTSLQNIWARN